jgi:alpha/beta superfamily hydrolase
MDDVQLTYDVTMRTDTSMGAPVAILLHGFSGNRIMMRTIALALADKGFICASVDLRGHGSSEGIMGGLDDFSIDVKAVIQSLQVKGIGDTSRLVLIGHSMGGGVILKLGSQLTSAEATIGVAPVSSPDWVNNTIPRNLLLIISTGDTVINSTTVKQTFYKSVDGTLAFNDPHDINGTMRELFVVDGPDHLNILYNSLVIGEIVKWATSYVLGAEQSLSISPDLINVAAYVSLIGGTVSIISALSLAHGKIWQEKRKLAASRQTYRKALLKVGFLAILLAGGFGSLVAIVVTFVLGLATPLFFTNFITALFLGNSIVFGLFARTKLGSSDKGFSYFKLIKESIRKPSLKVDASLGIIGALAFMTLLSVTLGGSTTSTFSTASMRIISLPLYTLLFAFVFVFYESFFKGFARPMMGDGVKRIVYSVLFELAVLFFTYLLELVAITTILSLFMPFISLGFFVLGINLVLIPLVISIVSAEVFYERAGGWISQIIMSSLIFATLSIVFSPALRSF